MQKLIYYEIAVSSTSAKRQAIFTYTSESKCSIGQLVIVKLRSKKVFGLVVGIVNKPIFKTKPVDTVLDVILPTHHINTLLWAVDYYPFDKGAVAKLFTPPIMPYPKSVNTLPTSGYTGVRLPDPTGDQKIAIECLKKSSPKTTILHGETGTGKTLVYVEKIKDCLKKGRSVILLVPEIALGEQIRSHVSKYISNIITYNSILSQADRRDIWYGVQKSTSPHLVIGPRSALFLPLKNIGAIIIDEAHDTSFKQQQAPYYATLHIAGVLAKEAGASLIYGSATPNTTDYKVASDKKYKIIRLKTRPIAEKSQLKNTFNIINTRDRGLFSRSQILSNDSIKAIRQSVKDGKQALLLLNKRGSAHLIQCDTCTWQYRCKTCDHNLVYHKDLHEAICHYCARKYPMHTICPIDKGPLRLLSVGTKYIEQECHKLFPGTSIIRLDTDSVSRDTIIDNMESLVSGRTSIIIGTQMIAKGLDLPLLDTVVIIDARRQSSDYLSDEQSYQLLHQVIGRGMRGYQRSTILLQTSEIDDPLIKWASSEDWKSFYEQELADRKKYRYPPYIFLAIYKTKKKNIHELESAVDTIAQKLKSAGLDIVLLGPMPSFFGAEGNEWQVIGKSNKRSTLITAGELLGPGWIVDLDSITA